MSIPMCMVDYSADFDVVSQRLAQCHNVVDWSGLPEEVLELIFMHLRYAADLIRIRAVCMQWRSVANKVRRHKKPLCPLLLLHNEIFQNFSQLFDFSKNKIHEISNLYPSDWANRRGALTNSCNGWLVHMEFTSRTPYAIRLINLFTRVEIQLPPAATLEYHPNADCPSLLRVTRMLRKVVLSSTPLDSSECVFVALYGQIVLLKLALCRQGDTTWKTIKCEKGGKAVYFADVVYFRDHFYALGRSKELFRCDIMDGDELKAIEIAQWEGEWDVEAERRRVGTSAVKFRSYLVDWCGEDLLMVVRYDIFNKVYINETSMFKVFKFDFGKGRWEEIESLGCGSILLGNCGTCIRKGEEDDLPEFRSNCIYFTCDEMGKGWNKMQDRGVFCLATKKFEPNPLISRIWPPPLFWISPDLSSP